MMKQLCFQIFGMSGRDAFSEFWPRYEANNTRVLQFLLSASIPSVFFCWVQAN
jgi:hypothetical protein